MNGSSKVMSGVMLGASVLLVSFAGWYLTGVVMSAPGVMVVIISAMAFVGSLIALASSVNVYRRARREG